MRSVVIILLTTVCAACAVQCSASSVVYNKQVILSVPVHVVYVDLNDRNVKVTVGISKSGRGSSESAASIVARTKPTAAITGTFFDTRTLLPTGDIVIGGIKAHKGCVGPSLCISPSNQAEIIPQKNIKRRISGNYETVIAGGPTLVNDGQSSLNPKAEGFHDPSLFGSANRTAVGITATNKLLMVSVNVPVSMHKMAKIMVKLGAVQAMLFDGGSSTALYAGGRFVSRPGRKLTNLLLVYESAGDFEKVAGQLAPTLFTADELIASVYRQQNTPSSMFASTLYEQLFGSYQEEENITPFVPTLEYPRLNNTWLLSAR